MPDTRNLCNYPELMTSEILENRLLSFTRATYLPTSLYIVILISTNKCSSYLLPKCCFLLGQIIFILCIITKLINQDLKFKGNYADID